MKLAKREGLNKHLIIMLHGTGGSASDLFGIGEILDSEATYIGIEGEVMENGMRRYFERYSDGSFNLESLAAASHSVYDEIIAIQNEYSDYNITVIGYSNGANIFTSVLKTFANVPVDAAILYHPSAVLEGTPFKTQTLDILITSGDNDPFITQEQFDNLAREYRAANINTSVYSHAYGHQLIQEELDVSKEFLL